MILFSCNHMMFVIDLRVRLGQIFEILNIHNKILVHLHNSNRIEHLVALQNHVATFDVKKEISVICTIDPSFVNSALYQHFMFCIYQNHNFKSIDLQDNFDSSSDYKK